MEHDPGTVLAYKWDEVVKHCLLTRHVYTPMLAYIGKRGMAKIPDDLKPDFLEAAAAATATCRAQVPAVEAEAVGQLRDKGISFNEVPPAELNDLRRRMAAELYPAFLKQYPDTAPLFAKIEATATSA
jgi:TRAP-type C4-dicarboxylate transport system substrate-binding protein